MVTGDLVGINTSVGFGANSSATAQATGSGGDFNQLLTSMANTPTSRQGMSGANVFPGALGISGMTGMPGMMGMSGVSGSGINGMNPTMMNTLMAPGLYEMQNGMLATASQGEMSGEHLMVFMMAMMMQTVGSGNGGGMGSDLAPIMQVFATMLSNLDSRSNNAVNPNNLVLSANVDMPRFGGEDSGVRRMVETALSKVGYHERNRDGSVGRGNFTKFGAWFGMNGQPWCAMFVSWAADQAGILNTVVPRHAWTPSGVAAYREKGMFEERGNGYLPREGDAIYFFSGAKGRVSHVGIVVAFDPVSQRVYTVEGNTNDQVAIRHYELNNTRIYGFGRNGGTGFGVPPRNSTSGDNARLI